MARFSSFTRIASVGALAALTALGTLAAPTSASADFIHINPCTFTNKCVKPGFINPNIFSKQNPPPVTINKYGNGWGYGAAALGGMAVGMIAAGAASTNASSGDCYLVRRQAVDEDGNLYVKRVRVCQ